MATSRFFTVAALASSLALPIPVAASAPLYGTGTSTLTNSELVSLSQADGNILIEQHNTRVDVGAFTGTVDEHLWLVVHPNGLVTFHAEATLDGVYPACSADPVSQPIRLAGRIAPTGELSATFATTNHATVIVQGTVAGSGASDTSDFEIQYHC